MPDTLAILAIGDELTSGQRVDTNSALIASKAEALGVLTVEHRTAPDDFEQMIGAIGDLCAKASVLVVTGGLGPTADDLTRQALARVLGDELVLDEDALAELRGWFAGRGRDMPEANKVQAMRPTSAEMLENPNGTAPGLSAQVNGARVFCLPGPPREMTPMLDRFVLGDLRRDDSQTVSIRTMPVFGLGESAVAERLGELMDRSRNPIVGTTASGCVVTCRLRHEGPAADADRLLDETRDAVRARLGDAILTDHDAFDDGHALIRAVSDPLREREETVGTVESCTGGLLGEMITRLPGSSDLFGGGLLTYSNDLKQQLAGVPHNLLAKHGAVSSQVASAMASGGRERLGTSHALAITGIAGPGGGSEDKPTGTVWIARSSSDGSAEARRFLFRGGRDAIRLWSATTALGMLRLKLIGKDMILLGQLDLVAETG
ncbi:MAG: CinA family nicotinamide mononucleotide deamidase-related protein [Planctomycetota bacterium]